MHAMYECQICKHVTEDRPPEWCPKCNGHRVIFKRIICSDNYLTLVEKSSAS